MKKIFSLFWLLALFLLGAGTVQAEEVYDFSENIQVAADGTLTVEEVIVYDFGNEPKHGIFRDIPYKYEARGGRYSLRLSNIKVTDPIGKAIAFSSEKKGNELRLKIGKEDELISGQHTYVISYKVGRAINFFDDYDELYWNAVGNGWPVAVRQSRVTIDLPAAAAEAETDMECFSGAYGSSEPCVSKRFVYEGAGQVKQAIFIDDVLQPGQAFTIVLGLPKGLLAQPGILLRFWDFFRDNWFLVFPFLTAFVLYQLWRRFGKDARGRGVLVAQFEAPAGLSPMGVGTLLDNRADNKDFSANIISLAVKGYLKIVSIESGSWLKADDYALIRLSQGQGALQSEQTVLDAIFKEKNLETDKDKLSKLSFLSAVDNVDEVVYLSDLRNDFYKDLSKIKKDIYAELTAEGYFYQNPQRIKTIYIVVGVTIIALSQFFTVFAGLIAFLSLAVSGAMVLIFAFIMPARTEKGSLAREHILGLKEYLRVAEADRLKFHNAPEKKPETFERLLPFAMVLGVEKEWAKQFESLYIDRQPAWYSGTPGDSFSAITLASSLSNFSQKSSVVAASRPSSAAGGGSGFSGGGAGGGFGGGGGGSW